MKLVWHRATATTKQHDIGARLEAFGNAGKYVLCHQYLGYGEEGWKVSLGGSYIQSNGADSFRTAPAAKSAAQKFENGVRSTPSSKTQRRRKRKSNPLNASEKKVLYVVLGIAAAGTAYYFYSKHSTSKQLPPGPAPAQLSVTLSPGESTERVNGVLTVSLPSGATWQSAMAGGNTITAPIGFSTPLSIPTATVPDGQVTFSWVDAHGTLQTSTIAIVG